MEYIGFIYIWTNIANGKKYIGSHKGNETDGYIGSGTAFREAYNKYGPENFKREILEYVETESEILLRENFYLKKHNVKNDRSFYNLKETATGGHCVDYTNTRNGWHKWAEKNLKKKVYKFRLDGEFVCEYNSLQDAANSVGAKSPSNIKYTCDGKFKCAHGFLWSFNETAPDVGEYLKTKGKKKVQTPDGIFNSVTDVVNHYGLTSSKIVRDRCLSTKDKWENWKYII